MLVGQNLDQLNTIFQSPVIVPANQTPDMINEFVKHPSNDQLAENAQEQSVEGVQLSNPKGIVSTTIGKGQLSQL